MNWQRGYKLSLLSQLPLFRMITTVQIYLGHLVFFLLRARIESFLVRNIKQLQLLGKVLASAELCLWLQQGGLTRTFRNRTDSPLGSCGSNPNKTLWNKERYRPTTCSTTGICASWLATASPNPYPMQLGTRVAKPLLLITTKIKWLVCFSWARILLSQQTTTPAGRTARNNAKTLISDLRSAIFLVFTCKSFTALNWDFK